MSEAFREAYAKVIPRGVVVASRNGMLFVYRPEVLRPLLDAKPELYRRDGESDLDSIARVSASGMNGELLGYGAIHMGVRPAYEVRIFKQQVMLLYCFISAPNEDAAARIANERTADFARAHGWKDLFFVMDFLP